jgi:hypothetical protein
MNPKSFKRVQTSGRRRWRHSGWLKDFQCEAHYQCMFLFLITECLKRSEVSLLHLCFVFKDVGKMVCVFISTFCAFCFCGSKVVLCKNNISLPISVFLKHRFEDRRKCHCRTPYVCVGWRFILKLLSECETICVCSIFVVVWLKAFVANQSEIWLQYVWVLLGLFVKHGQLKLQKTIWRP